VLNLFIGIKRCKFFNEDQIHRLENRNKQKKIKNLDCDRDETYKSAKTSTQSASKKCSCPSKIRSTPLKDGFE